MVRSSRSLDELIHISLRSLGCLLPLVLFGSLELPDAPKSSYVFGWSIESRVCSITARAHHPKLHQQMDIFLAHRLDFILVFIQAPSNTNHKYTTRSTVTTPNTTNHTEIQVRNNNFRKLNL